MMCSNLVDIIEYLKGLPDSSRVQLYEMPVFAVSFLKLLDESSVRFVFDLLLKSYSVTSLKGKREIARMLLNICIAEKRGDYIYLNKKFRMSLLEGFCMLTVEKYYRRAWDGAEMESEEDGALLENLLKFIVDREFLTDEFGVKEVLVFGGLLDFEKNITNKGFEFLLKTRKEQLWCLILLSLKYFLDSIDEELIVVEALFELSTKSIGVMYQQTREMNEKLFLYFESLGILKMCTGKLVLKPSFMLLFETMEQDRREFMIVETNHKVYAYTNSEYEWSVVKLFCNITMRFPNLIKGIISEESMNAAFDKGITSKQIIHFLQSSVKEGSLPHTVSNQIEIWESMRNRIFIVPGYLYSDFLNLSDYQKILELCVDQGCLVDSDLDRRVIIIKLEAYDVVKDSIEAALQ